jgi:peroxiredoxin
LIALRLPLTAVFVASTLFAAEGEVAKAALRLDLVSSKAPKPLAMEFRILAADALRERHPDLANKFVEQTVAELNAGKDWVVGYKLIQGLAQASPTDAIAVLPKLVPGYAQIVIAALAQSRRAAEAMALYMDLLKRGEVRASGASSLLLPLVKQDPAKAAKVFHDVLATLPDPLDPSDASWVVNIAGNLAPTSPQLAADAIERVLKAATAPDYAEISSPVILGAFADGTRSVNTTNTRDTLLLLTATRLRAIAPDRLAPYQDALSKWNLSGLQMKSISYRASTPVAKPGDTRALENSIRQRTGQIRGKATDAERAVLVQQIAADIRKLPPGEGKIGAIRSLASVSTEGALGKEALTAVASTLAAAMRDSFPVLLEARQPLAYGDAYIELARYVRYEQVEPPFADPALDAAGALLELRERVQQENGFTLTSLDGKIFSLDALKGKVVLLNFWATWCPPCRKEMPDMDKLYKELESKGLVVLAVSDEDRPTVEQFLAKTPYSFPVLLDPGRTVNKAFMVEGIPKSFIFDRDGRLAALAIDMRTEEQFRLLLKQAGL